MPGTLTTAYPGPADVPGRDFDHVVVPFDEIIEPSVAGEYEGQRVDAGLIIHEGQLTYAEQNLQLVVDMGQWWYEETGLAAAAGRQRHPQGPRRRGDSRRQPAAAGEHPATAWSIARRRSTTPSASAAGWTGHKADQFVGMYVNDWTLDFGERGRQAVARAALPAATPPA